MEVELSRPTSQTGLTAVAKILDEVFGIAPPATMLRVGFMNDLLRSSQLVLLAGSEAKPLGAIVALRGPDFVELADMVVSEQHQNKGIGRQMFNATCEWATTNGYSEVRWCVSPSNLQGVGAYLSYGGRIAGWIDNAYGVASDALYTDGNTDRFRGLWRSTAWPAPNETKTVRSDDYAELRSLLTSGWQIIGRSSSDYTLEHH